MTKAFFYSINDISTNRLKFSYNFRTKTIFILVRFLACYCTLLDMDEASLLVKLGYFHHILHPKQEICIKSLLLKFSSFFMLWMLLNHVLNILICIRSVKTE
jgi:hypothetical protein